MAEKFPQTGQPYIAKRTRSLWTSSVWKAIKTMLIKSPDLLIFYQHLSSNYFTQVLFLFITFQVNYFRMRRSTSTLKFSKICFFL